jgi:hypothetical protein
MGLLPNAEGSHVVVMEVSVHIRVHMATRVTPGPALHKPTLVTTKSYWHTVVTTKVVLTRNSCTIQSVGDYTSSNDLESPVNTKT